MTSKRRIRLFTGFLAACVCATLAIFALLSEPGVSKARFDRIQIGMTEADAEAIFARPSGSTLTIVEKQSGSAMTICFDPGKGCAWLGGDGDAMVLFDADGRISKTTWIDHEWTLLEKMQDWLRLRK